MRRAAYAVLLAVFVAATAAASVAQAESTVIHLNQSRRVVLRGTAANIIVGDPSVADVTVIDSHSVILQGKGYGSTDVLVMDRAGRTLLDDHVMVSAPGNRIVVTIHRGINVAPGVEFSCTCSPRCQSLMTSAKDTPAAATG